MFFNCCFPCRSSNPNEVLNSTNDANPGEIQTDSPMDVNTSDYEVNRRELEGKLTKLFRAIIKLSEFLVSVSAIVLVAVIGSKFLVHILVFHAVVWAIAELINYYCLNLPTAEAMLRRDEAMLREIKMMDELLATGKIQK